MNVYKDIVSPLIAGTVVFIFSIIISSIVIAIVSGISILVTIIELILFFFLAWIMGKGILTLIGERK